MSHITVGEVAPAFTLQDQYGQDTTLGHDGPVLLVFYPLAFSGICSGELADLKEHHAQLRELGVTVLAVSVDSTFALRTWSDREDFPFALLSDFWPHGDVARAYGVFDPERGIARRGTFLIDSEGIVRWSVLTPTGRPRDVTAYLERSRALTG
ncbi:peroxiredoxin [Nocardiopsis sp. MG754419]|uniref:peroxiredoxin n=1 Tax=Nocardiopsis sp. MG754419 TaxID=2259865 RepID=UPI001BADE176|nr:peroxiredoxin [Nocardiopsis sp. MG754419]MBR8742881.1 peroxiredoxin [Nocardiopsis sp. MG754419]